MEHVISIERNYADDITPMVTIVLPCYNYADFLPAAVQSTADQTFQSFEVIIVNDGSTDNTLEVARELLQKYRGR
ncbi:MAG: glycosyltransferase, partial [Actinobacteria bacterium]|nr:glycosyltransferase [Actinomycetota bacterium]